MLIDNRDTNEVASFRRIRKAIGILALSFPTVLWLLSQIPFFDTTVQPSISHYYYTNFRDLFTGILCAIGLFLIRYKGHTNSNFFKNDNKLTNLAGFMAFGVALVPTNPSTCCQKTYSLIPLCCNYIGWLHYGFAAALFVVLSIISINVFTIGQNQTKGFTKSIIDENNIYKTCGYTMLALLILTPICEIFKCFAHSTLVFEALMLALFGISWLIKGRILGDKGKIGQILYQESN